MVPGSESDQRDEDFSSHAITESSNTFNRIYAIFELMLIVMLQASVVLFLKR